MTEQVLDRPSVDLESADDLLTAIQKVLANSPEPLTLPKLRTKLPQRLRSDNLEETLQRQVAANVLYQFPKYRSQHDRYWDRPMSVHVAALLRESLQEGPLAWSALRRKMPSYAQSLAEGVLQEQLALGQIFRHPYGEGRGASRAERLGLLPPDPKDYLRSELQALFVKLAKTGFTTEQLRAGALELLHDDEWSPEQEPVRVAEEEQPSAGYETSTVEEENFANGESIDAPSRIESETRTDCVDTKERAASCQSTAGSTTPETPVSNVSV